MSANINTNPTVVTVFGDSWSTTARWDAFHPNPDPAQRIAVDFGQKLRVALAGY